MIPQNQRPWERLIRDLHRGFSLLEKEIGLLREIEDSREGTRTGRRESRTWQHAADTDRMLRAPCAVPYALCGDTRDH